MNNIRDTHTCIQQLLQHVPELRPAYEEHLKDNYDELLPHVFMGRVTDYVLQQVRSGGTAPLKPLERILGNLEECMASGSEDVKELVGASFIENLAGEEDALVTLSRLMGPNLRAQLQFIGFRESGPEG